MKYRILFISLVIILVSWSVGCSSEDDKPDSPKETFMTYTKAVKRKDITAMKLLLSNATMKMNELEAQARGVPVDEVVKNETLFNEHQTTVKLRNEKINGDTATLEVENSTGMWETVPFVREEGVWKIDKKGFAQRMMEESDKSGQEIDNMFNDSRQMPPTPQP
jgi:hypothetical protein